jgi:hypothetical protein
MTTIELENNSEIIWVISPEDVPGLYRGGGLKPAPRIRRGVSL